MRRWALTVAFLAIVAQPATQSASAAASPPVGVGLDALILGALRPTAAPTFVTTLDQGRDLISVPVTYAFTGVLRNEVRDRMSFGISKSTKPIPAGTPVFGIPMSYPTGLAPHPRLTWCAALVEPNGPEKPSRWNVTCFPKIFNKMIVFVPLGEDIFPASFSIRQGEDMATVPDIEEKPVDLNPPLKLAILFAGWEHNAAELRVVVRQPQHTPFPGLLGGSQSAPGEQTLARERLPLDATGAAHLPLFGGEILIRPGPDGKSAAAEIAKPFLIGSAGQ